MNEPKRSMARMGHGLLVLVLALSLVPLTVFPAHAANPGDVVINEFVAKGAEWVELFNPSGGSMDITGWTLTDGEDDEVLSGSIAPGGYLAIDTSLALSNTGDEIQLKDGSGGLVDEVAYGTHGGAPLPPYGTSTSRSPNGADTDDFAHDWNVDQTPTREAANDGPGTALGSSVILNEQNAYSPGSDFYELYNPTGTAIDVGGWQASDGDDIRTLSGSIPSGGFLVFTDLYISGSDVMYLWDASGVRVDQLGRDGEWEDGTFQRLPDGAGPNDGYDFASSGGGAYYFDCTATPGEPNGTKGCFDRPTPLTIPEIQGDGRESPYAGWLVTTRGVVTLMTPGGFSFWIQDPDGDGDPATSDGIYVYGGGTAADVRVGDYVKVTDAVSEYVPSSSLNSLPLTEFAFPNEVEILSSGNPLPAAIPVMDLPNVSITEGIAFWEPLEGMRVSVDNGFVVAPTSRYGEFAMLTEADADADLGSGYFAQTKQVLISNLGGEDVDYNPERILVDDSSLDDPIFVQPGDRVRSLVGVVDYTFGNYKLQPESFDVKTHKLTKLPASTRSGPKGNAVITTFNVENLFDLVDNPDKEDQGSTPLPEELEIQLTKLALAIQVELQLPDIMVVQEVENIEILQELGDRVNAAAGTDYMAVSFETSDVRGIEVGFLWDANRVSLMEAFQMSGPDVEDWFGPGSPSPGREPLVGVFEIQGYEITIIGNHFKSKGGDDPLFGVNWPPIRVTEEQRKGQAMAVRAFVDGILDDDPNALVMVTGDLNDFQFGEPGEGPDHPVAILEGVNGKVPLINLLGLEKPAETYTYIYDGNSQVLDHMLVSPALLDMVAGADILHFNAGFPSNLGRDPSTTLRASDHDALEGRFRLK